MSFITKCMGQFYPMILFIFQVKLAGGRLLCLILAGLHLCGNTDNHGLKEPSGLLPGLKLLEGVDNLHLIKALQHEAGLLRTEERTRYYTFTHITQLPAKPEVISAGEIMLVVVDRSFHGHMCVREICC